MAYKDLHEFLARLEREHELVRVRAEVDPVLEIAEIADRAVKRGGPALLFENPKGSRVPVAINLFGSLRRMCLALEVDDLDEIGSEIEDLLKPEIPEGIAEGFRFLGKLKRLADLAPRTVRTAPCQEVVRKDDFSLEEFPILKCWPEDGGRFLTFPLVITRDPETGDRNVGLYRMQVFDGRTTAMHWHPQKGGRQHYRVAERLGKRLPVAVALGADPALLYAASAPLPEGIDEILFAGFLRKKSVEMVKCVSVDLEVPASAEIVLEGYVDPGERRTEGPFGDHTGYYSLADEFPVFHVTAITNRKDPIYATIIVGPPPMEDAWLGKATERIFLPILKKQFPEIVDLNFPVEGVFHNLAIVSIEKRYPGQAQKVMAGLWGLGQMAFTKTLVVVDADVNIEDPREVLWKAGNHIDPERDVMFLKGPVDILDHASRLPGFGSKMGIDATRKGPADGFTRAWPPEIRMSPEVKARMDLLWSSLGIG